VNGVFSGIVLLQLQIACGLPRMSLVVETVTECETEICSILTRLTA